MSFRTFIIGLAASFGFAWLAVVVVPFFKMRNLEPIAFPDSESTAEVFFPKRSGRIADGAQVYAENGCYLCHTQVVRPTYAGNDLFYADLGGLANDSDRGDTRRETNAFDFLGEDFAQIGVARIGPDLSNVALRVTELYRSKPDRTPDSWRKSPEAWLYGHLYNPRRNPVLWKSTCPPHPFLFESREITGQPSDDALEVDVEDGHEVVPGSAARALVSYLMSLKKDHPVPAELNFAPARPAAP